MQKGPQEGGQTNWAWSGGAPKAKGAEEPAEDFATRQKNRAAVNEDAEREAAFARRTMQQAQKLREEEKAERIALRKKEREKAARGNF